MRLTSALLRAGCELTAALRTGDATDAAWGRFQIAMDAVRDAAKARRDFSRRLAPAGTDKEGKERP